MKKSHLSLEKMVLCQGSHHKTSQSFEYPTVLYGVPVSLKQHKPIIAHPAIWLYLNIHWVVRLCLRIEYNVSVAKVKRQISAPREETCAWSKVTNRQRLHQVQVVQCLLTARGESAQDPAPGSTLVPHTTYCPPSCSGSKAQLIQVMRLHESHLVPQWKTTDPSSVGSEIQKAGDVPGGHWYKCLGRTKEHSLSLK